MIPLAEAQAYVLAACHPLPVVDIDRRRALGWVTATAVTAGESVPPFANTAVDGYAVQAADTGGAPVTLRVVGALAAGGSTDTVLGPGEAIRIMTGAPVPAGADAVVMVEQTSTSSDGGEVTVEVAIAPGAAIREVGDDVRPGDVVVEAGLELTPARLGVLASVGIDRVTVHRRPRVGVLSTGDELVTDDGPLGPGRIRDANRPMLLALVEQVGCEPVDLGLVGDDEQAVTDAIEAGAATCDALLTSGGVSMGDFDYVKVVLDRLGDMRWMQVAIKPAKPLAFGTVDGVPVVGLPGNPVSSLVSFELFARPALRRLAGHAELHRPLVSATAVDGLHRSSDGKVHFVRVVATADGGRWTVRSAGGQGSHQLAAMATANALAVVPDGPAVAPGEPVSIMLLG